MTIYGEIVFIENFVTGWMILLLTGKLRGTCAERRRIAAGSVMCGAYVFVLFVQMHWLAALASKLLFSLVVVLVVFGAGTWRCVIKTTAVFYIVSFLMGGVTIALMYMMKIPGMTANGSFALKGTAFIQITAGVAATWYLGSWLAGLLKEKAVKRSVIRDVEISIASQCWKIKALVDTGNSLNEPVTGWPVAVLSKDLSEDIWRICDSEQFSRFVVIPYRTVGRASIMHGIRMDRIIVDGQPAADVVLGFGEKNFSPWKGIEKYDLLLHQQFLEGKEE